MSISVSHLTKKGYTSAGRIKIEGKPRGTGEGTTGLTLELLREAFKHYELHRKYCDMDYKLPETCKDYFIKHNEDTTKYDLIFAGKEVNSTYVKGAFRDRETNRIVLRSATFHNPEEPDTRTSYTSLDPHWKVKTGLFTADISFWEKLSDYVNQN
jgi:hypothetical protein